MELVNLNASERPTDCTVNGKCSQCGGCCPSMLPVTDKDMSVLKTVAATVRPHTISPTPNTVTVDFTCPFLVNAGEDKTRCSIYNYRPLICRKFTCHVFGKPTNEQFTKLSGISDEETKLMASAKHYNLWNLFGKTGLVFDGKELSLDDAPVITLCMDDGSERKVRIGTYVELGDSTDNIVKGILAGVDKRGLNILTPYRELVTIPC